MITMCKYSLSNQWFIYDAEYIANIENVTTLPFFEVAVIYTERG